MHRSSTSSGKKAKEVYEINNNGDQESGGMYYRWDENTLKKLAEQGCFMLVTVLSYLGVLEPWPLHHGYRAAINGGSSHQRTNDEQIKRLYVLSMFDLNNSSS
uniref:Uncharacterized protein n=1 Tax=Nelumbo nucifera TaxID=4432 RepID=A0A822ZD03_NELNU|nr:TPA_asm: hypothetical protein HUJ06_000620 [Nelumbo nucifera]